MRFADLPPSVEVRNTCGEMLTVGTLKFPPGVGAVTTVILASMSPVVKSDTWIALTNMERAGYVSCTPVTEELVDPWVSLNSSPVPKVCCDEDGGGTGTTLDFIDPASVLKPSRNEYTWAPNGDLTQKRIYSGVTGTYVLVYTFNYVWDPVTENLTSKDQIRASDGKILHADYFWTVDGDLLAVTRTVI